jgi:DNA polymerase III subunit epsilon
VLDHHFVFLDLETTGAAAARDRITEIGLVEVAYGRPVGEWSTLVNPGMPIPTMIQSLTGITDDMVSDAPSFGAVAPELARRLEGKVLAAHNARFDYGFLKSEFSRAGLQYSATVLCTVMLSRRLYPEHRKHNLDTLMERHGVACTARHRALGDARVLWDLAQTWSQDRGMSVLSDAIARCLKSPPASVALPDLMLDDIPEGHGVYTLYGENGVALYVGRSSNLRTRVASHFSGGGRNKRIPEEVRRVDWTQTAGELGAWLRESRLLDDLAPLHNRRVRQPAQIWTWRWSVETPAVAPQLSAATDTVACDSDELYGLFRSRASALEALRELALAHELCFAATGLEETPGPCYARLSKRCRGACVDAESDASHALRLADALARLRVARWPYAGAIAVQEDDGERCEVHVIDRWRYLGSARTEAEVHELACESREGPFDLNTYRILSRYLGRAGAAAQVRRLARPTHRAPTTPS